MDLNSLREQAATAVDDAYSAGYAAALAAVQNYWDSLDTDDYDQQYLDGVDDTLTTIEQSQPSHEGEPHTTRR